MLSNNMLRNLNTSYGKMSKLQSQIQTGSKITRPSDDPVIAVRGMGYRTELDKICQYQRNTNEANAWLDTSDEALDQVGNALHRVKELIVQAANDTNTADDRAKILEEIEQIEKLGYGNYPVCIAKTQYSLSDNAKNLLCDEPFRITIKEAIVKNGAEFVVIKT